MAYRIVHHQSIIVDSLQIKAKTKKHHLHSLYTKVNRRQQVSEAEAGLDNK